MVYARLNNIITITFYDLTCQKDMIISNEIRDDS